MTRGFVITLIQGHFCLDIFVGDVSWSWHKVKTHFDTFKVTKRKSAKLLRSLYHLEKQWEFLLHKMIAYDLRILTQGLLKSLWSLEEKNYNLCLLYIFIKEKYWKFLPHIKIANDLRVCHKLGPGPDVQVYCKKNNA